MLDAVLDFLPQQWGPLAGIFVAVTTLIVLVRTVTRSIHIRRGRNPENLELPTTYRDRTIVVGRQGADPGPPGRPRIIVDDPPSGGDPVGEDGDIDSRDDRDLNQAALPDLDDEDVSSRSSQTSPAEGEADGNAPPDVYIEHMRAETPVPGGPLTPSRVPSRESRVESTDEREARERAWVEEETRVLRGNSYIPEENTARAVDVLFATNREQYFYGKFSGERSDETLYGSARVLVPIDRVPGKIRRPLVIAAFGFEIYREKEDPSRHFIITYVDTMDLGKWQTQLAQKDTALLFIHGYNVTFEDALIHIGQIAWDLRTAAAPVLFSWPSRGKLLEYKYDADSTDFSTGALGEVLANMAASGVKTVHVLAHSMGCQLLIKALRQYQGPALRFGQVMMAAPDMDRDSFRKHAGAVVQRADGVTVYASSIDKALALSREIAGGVPRAGDVPPGGPIVVTGIDTIDVTELGGDIVGHGTFGQAGSILNDLNILIRTPVRPPDVRQVSFHPMPKDQPVTYWRYVKSLL